MGSPEFPEVPRTTAQSTSEDLNPRHFYAAYIYEYGEVHELNITTLLASAQELDYPVRYWWLSEVMDIRDDPDRLIICVHHPFNTEDAGMDLYDKLKTQQVKWDELEAATVEEYRQFGKPVSEIGQVNYPDGGLLFPLGEPSTVEWRAAQQPLAIRLEWKSPHLTDLPGLQQRKIRQALGKIALLMTSVLKQKEALTQAGTELDFTFTLLADLMTDITAVYQLSPEQRTTLFDQLHFADHGSSRGMHSADEPFPHAGSDDSHTDTAERTAFAAWFDEVDAVTMSIAGCSIRDLPDIDFWSLFSSGALPVEAATEALSEAGYPGIE